MKKLAVILATLSLSTCVFASPVASFSALPVTQESFLEELAEDTKMEIELIKGIWNTICSERGVSPYLVSPDLTIPASEYDRIYTERLARHNAGTHPLPIRYLPYDYDNAMTVADATGSDKTVMYEVVLGYPIFYKISRYQRPTNHIQLNDLPTNNGDKLDTGTLGITGKLGTLNP